MGVRVVADLVAGGDDGADERGMDGGVFADNEKRGARPVRGEQGKDAESVCRIGAVVDGKPDFAGGGGEAVVHAEETLCVWGENVISKKRVRAKPERESGAGGGASEEHGGDFTAEVEGDDEHGGGA